MAVFVSFNFKNAVPCVASLHAFRHACMAHMCDGVARCTCREAALPGSGAPAEGAASAAAIRGSAAGPARRLGGRPTAGAANGRLPAAGSADAALLESPAGDSITSFR